MVHYSFLSDSGKNLTKLIIRVTVTKLKTPLTYTLLYQMNNLISGPESVRFVYHSCTVYFTCYVVKPMVFISRSIITQRNDQKRLEIFFPLLQFSRFFVFTLSFLKMTFGKSSFFRGLFTIHGFIQ